MGRLQSRVAAARRSRAFWPVTAVVVVGLVAGGVALATRTTTPAPSPSSSTRAVALGDSVPYGHGLANPYLTPQRGLPPTAVSQGPSLRAYPSEVAARLGLTMTVRPTNCALTGDQLSISGAVADAADNTTRDGQCLHPPQQARNLGDQIAASNLTSQPAKLVVLQDGADDIQFASCLEFQLATVLHANLGLGTSCVQDGALTPQLVTHLSHVRTSLAAAIEELSPHAGTVAVLDYYQPVPSPSQIGDDTGQQGLGTNLVCTGLKANAAATYAAAQVVLKALNAAVAGAVADAQAHGVHNARLVDVSNVVNGHAMCTPDPWIFSGEPISDATLAADVERILAAKACTGTSVLHGAAACASLVASADQAEVAIKGYVWRAAHPNASGQRAIAAATAQALRGHV